MRIKRTLEDSSSNKLAMMEVIRVNICFTYPEIQFAEPKSEPQIIDDMAAFIKEAETKTCLLKLVRCRYSPSYTDECPKSSNNQIICQLFGNGEECHQCRAIMNCDILKNNIKIITTNSKLDDQVGKYTLIWLPTHDKHVSGEQAVDDVYALTIESHKAIEAILKCVQANNNIIFSIDWDSFCQDVRTIMYASKAIETADVMAYKITKKWQHEDAGYDVLPQARMVFNAVMDFMNIMLNNGMRNTHQKMISGKFLQVQAKYNQMFYRLFSVIKTPR